MDPTELGGYAAAIAMLLGALIQWRRNSADIRRDADATRQQERAADGGYDMQFRTDLMQAIKDERESCNTRIGALEERVAENEKRVADCHENRRLDSELYINQQRQMARLMALLERHGITPT